MKRDLRDNFRYAQAGGGFLWGFLTMQIVGAVIVFAAMAIAPDADITIAASAVGELALIAFYGIYTMRGGTHPLKAAKLSDPKPLLILLAIPLTFVCLYSFAGLADLFDTFLKAIGYVSQNPLVDLGLNGNPAKFILYLLLLAVLPAIAEELIFRGIVLQGIRARFGDGKAILFSALAFMIMHCSPDQTVYQFFLGLTAAYLTVRSGSIFPAMILHFANNAISLFFEFFGVFVFTPSHIGFLIPYALVMFVVGALVLSLVTDALCGTLEKNIFYRLFTSSKRKRAAAKAESVSAEVVKDSASAANGKTAEACATASDAPSKTVLRPPASPEDARSTTFYCVAFGICVFMWLFSFIGGLIS